MYFMTEHTESIGSGTAGESGGGREQGLYRFSEALEHPQVVIVSTMAEVDLLLWWNIPAICLPEFLTPEHVALLRAAVSEKRVFLIHGSMKRNDDLSLWITPMLAETAVSVEPVHLPGITDDCGVIDWCRLTGNGRNELIALLEGASQETTHPTQLPVLFAPQPAGTNELISSSHQVGISGTFSSWSDERIETSPILRVIAYVRDEMQERWGKLIEIVNLDDHHHRVVIPFEWFSGDGIEIRRKLLSLGMMIPQDRDSHKLLNAYLLHAEPENDKRALLVDKSGWHGNAFVLPSATIGASDEMIIYQPPTPELVGRFAQRLSLEDWVSRVSRYCRGNSRLIFSVSTAFAAPLLRLLNIEGGGFHLVSCSSAGKTTSLKVASSVCGGPNYRRQWRATDNALEATAASHNDALLVLDEIAEVLAKIVGMIAYMLANGFGKLRASGSKTQLTWRILTLSSGEIRLADHINDGGRIVMAGQEVRLVDFPAEADAGLGIFEDLHDFSSPEAFAKALEDGAKEAYGTPFVAFLERLTAGMEDALAFVRTAMEDFLTRYQAHGADSQQRRIERRFALVAAAGELATRFGITGWQEGESVTAVARCMKDWRAYRYGNESQASERMIEQVNGFFEFNAHSRFQALTDRTPTNGDCAGFRSPTSCGGTDFYVIPEVFRSEICKGFDVRLMCQMLSEKGLLVSGEGRHDILKRIPAWNGKAHRFYQLTLSPDHFTGQSST